MSVDTAAIVEVDGLPPSSGDLVEPALVDCGHFTATQVRGGAVRGLAEHRERLRAADAELFGADLDLDAVQSFMRRAVRSRPDAYLESPCMRLIPASPAS
jgi:hypothetical protein